MTQSPDGLIAIDAQRTRRAGAGIAALALTARRLHGRSRLRAADGADARRVQGRAGVEGRATRDDAPRGNWWEAFGDPELERARGAGRHLQPDGARPPRRACARRWRRRRRRARRCSRWSTPTARRCAASHGTGSSSSANTSSGVNNSYNVALSASWEVDLWGGIRRSIEASETSRAGQRRRPGGRQAFRAGAAGAGLPAAARPGCADRAVARNRRRPTSARCS